MSQLSLTASALFVCALQVGCSANYPKLMLAGPEATTGTCLIHGRVLAGDALTLLEDADVCFAGKTLTLVSPHATAPLPANVEVVDVTGKTVMPGLIDTHVHVVGTDAPPWDFSPPDEEHNLEAWVWAAEQCSPPTRSGSPCARRDRQRATCRSAGSRLPSRATVLA